MADFFFLLSFFLSGPILLFSFLPCTEQQGDPSPTALLLKNRNFRICSALFLPSVALALWVRIALVSANKQPPIPLFFLELAWVYSNFYWFLPIFGRSQISPCTSYRPSPNCSSDFAC
ncbi:hypothetical protein SLEP1_g6607 [Rubroshorea leprosula]|uniref:Uncharacterized protein n=1 Tax=Rubroshorea leprosula TaxID=152421 RepID=A0AAV5I405_9ROSI|nr:hypothetical protein SLEP1_g6607 [Rubroshorea leprosula]